MTVSTSFPSSAKASLVPETAQKANAILHGPAYRFCRDPAYPWTDGEAEWCKAVGPRSDSCDALPRACAGEMTRFEGSGRRRRGVGEGQDDRESFELRLPHIGPIGSYITWAAIAIAVLVVLRLIWMRAIGSRQGANEGELKVETARPDDVPEKSAVEIDVERLLDRARRAAAEGRFADGIADAYAALLRQLEGERLIRVDSWRTNGDYLRELAPEPEVRAGVSGIVRSVEAVQFGGAVATGERFEGVFRQVTTLLTASSSRLARKASVLATATIACMALAFVSCSDLMHLRGAEDDSPSGTSAVVELLQRSGFVPRMRFRSLTKDIEANQIVLLPGAHVEKDAWGALMDWVSDGGTLIVANRDHALSEHFGVQFSSRPGLRMDLTVDASALETLRGVSVVVAGTSDLVIADAVSHEDLLTRDGTVYATRFEHGDGTIVALADGRLFTNVSLAMADNAGFLVALLEEGEKKVDLVGELTGSGAKSPLSSVERGKLAPVLLQLALVLVLFFLYKGIAFGTLSDPPTKRRQSFAEHARALGMLYAKASASGHARAVYGAYTLERLRDSMLFRDQKGISALADVVAARAGRPLGQVAMMLVEAQEPRPYDPKEKGSPEDLDLIRRLSRLLRQSKGGSK